MTDTASAINFAKQLCKNPQEVMVGGVMASILADRVEAATGIRPHVGTLDTPGELDAGNDMIIDTLPLDYSILEEIDYQYPASNAYYAYMTRGCVNKCKFCAVPKLEPVYKQFLPVSDQVRTAEARYGAKRDLLLLDNNVLASCRFNDIIDDIKKAGFSNDATYVNAFPLKAHHLLIGDNTLSGGQRQRLLIARALSQEADIYVFDEMFSAIGIEQAQRIIHNMRRLYRNATFIIVTHELALARNADYICCFRQGKFEGIGSHEEMMETSNGYRELAESVKI